MRSPPRIARARRSTAGAMSRKASGSFRSANAGLRKRRAAAGSASPRCASTLAARGERFSPAASPAASGGSAAGNTQRALVLGEIPAKRIAFVDLVFGDAGGDLVFDAQELFVPIGLKLVDVEPGVVIEGQLQRAGQALVTAQLSKPPLVVA